MKRAAVVLLCLAAAATAAADDNDNPLLIELPSGALAADVGAGGFVVVGTLRSGGAFYWMPTSGVVPIGGSQGVAVSRDGRTIVGRARDGQGREQAAIWQGGAEWRLLGSFTPDAAACDGLLSGSFGASADASVIVGLGWNGCRFARGFRWEEATGMVDLGSSVPGRSSRANDASGNGRTIVGWQDQAAGFRQGARWVDGRQELFVGPAGQPMGEAHAANSDGSLIVGQTCDAREQSAWSWTPQTGVRCHAVPRLRPQKPYIGMMLATSDDGRVIGGAQSFGLESEAVLWLDGEAVYLKEYLEDHGVSDAFRGWVNTGFVTAVSPDGRVIVGQGAGATDFQGYVVILGLPGARESEMGR